MTKLTRHSLAAAADRGRTAPEGLGWPLHRRPSLKRHHGQDLAAPHLAHALGVRNARHAHGRQSRAADGVPSGNSATAFLTPA